MEVQCLKDEHGRFSLCQQHLLLHSHCAVVLGGILDRMRSEGQALEGGHMSCPFYNWLWSYVFRFTKPSHWFRAAGCFMVCLLLELHHCVSAHVRWREVTSLGINSVLAIRHLWYCWFWWKKKESDWTGKTMELSFKLCAKCRTDHYMVNSVQMLSSGSIPFGANRDLQVNWCNEMA